MKIFNVDFKIYLFIYLGEFLSFARFLSKYMCY